MFKWAFDNFIKKYKLDFAIYIFLKTISGILVFFPPIFIGKSIDDAIRKNIFGIAKNIIFILLILVINATVSIFESKIAIKISFNVTCDLKLKIIYKFLNMEQYNIDLFNRGEVLSRLDDADNVVQMFIEFSTLLFIDVISFIFALGVMFYISPILSLVCMINIPMVTFIQRIFGEKIAKKEEKVKKSNDDYLSLLYEIIDAFKNIKVMNLQMNFYEKFKNKIENNKNLNINKSKITIYAGFVSIIINGVFQIVLLAIGCLFIVSGIISVGNYFTFNSYVSKFNLGLQNIAQFFLKKQVYYVSIKRINELFSLQEEKERINGSNDFFEFTTMSIRNMNFKYNEQSEFVLKLNDFIFKKNEIIAIIGENGKGKSTLFDLIVGIYPFEGDIFWDDKNLNCITLELRRRMVCYVQQKPFFFKGTIFENLILEDENISKKAVEDACNKVGMDSFIDNLDLKYDTIIQEGGGNFSGGQLQRLALARAILSNSEVILLDEITSSVDMGGKQELYNAIKEMKKNKMIVVVSHDMDIKEIADKIIYI